ncbi:hypothetical protein SFUMM280S_03854 [Streptomyces fumanus]
MTPADGEIRSTADASLLGQDGRQVGRRHLDPAHPVLDGHGTRLGHHQVRLRLQPGPQYVVVLDHRAQGTDQGVEVQPGR